MHRNSLTCELQFESISLGESFQKPTDFSGRHRPFPLLPDLSHDQFFYLSEHLEKTKSFKRDLQMICGFISSVKDPREDSFFLSRACLDLLHSKNFRIVSSTLWYLWCSHCLQTKHPLPFRLQSQTCVQSFKRKVACF